MIGINMCMPKKCSECPCVQVDYEGDIDPCCYAKDDWPGLSDKEYSEQKPDWCPLIDLDAPTCGEDFCEIGGDGQ